MFQLSEQQLSKRYYSLPSKIKDILDSPNIGDIVKNICVNYHLSSEKLESINIIISEILLGFSHVEDLSKEISANTGIDKRIADSIVNEINNKIFSSIKDDLKKVYFPVEKVDEFSPEVSEILRKSRQLMAEIEQELKIKDKQKHIIDLRNSKIEEIFKPKEIPLAEKKEEIKTESPLNKSEPMPTEGPVIIHQEAEFKPTLGAKRPLSGLFNALKGKEEVKPITAQIETFIQEPPLEEQLKNIKIAPEQKKEVPKIIQQIPTPPKIVHYSDFRTVLSPAPETKKAEITIQPKEVISPINKIKIPIPLPPKVETSQKNINQNVDLKIDSVKSHLSPALKEQENLLSTSIKQKRKGFFSWLIGLFISKEKILKEIPEKEITKEIFKEISLPKIIPEIKKEQPIPEIKPINIPAPSIIPKNPSIPSSSSPKHSFTEPVKPLEQIFTAKTQDFSAVKSAFIEEIKQKPVSSQVEPVKPQSQILPVAPTPKVESPKISPQASEEVIDLRTFQKFKNNSK